MYETKQSKRTCNEIHQQTRVRRKIHRQP